MHCLEAKLIHYFLNIYFEIIMDRDGEEPYVFKTFPYRIGVCNFVMPNEILNISKDMFFENWYNLRFQTQLKCHVTGIFVLI